MKPKSKSSGLKFSRHLSKEGVSVYDLFKYEVRKSVIRNPDGKPVFEMDRVEVPSNWSQVATDILAQKYFRKTGVPGPDGLHGGETSIKQVVHRLADCWRKWGMNFGYFASEQDAQVFYDETVYMMLDQAAAPNSPQWFNTGLFSSYGIKGASQGHYYVDPADGMVKQSLSAYERPQPHACFILSVKDDLVNPGGIMDLWTREARIFKYGSGVGTNFSTLRSENEQLSGGGYSSGLMSFLKIGDRAAGAIKSGGTTRRAAKMVCLDIDHPEIEKFINWKVEEENKVAALIAAGYPADYEGEAYQTVSGQNSNNSVRVPDSFFEALHSNRDWKLTSRTSGEVIKSVPASSLWEKISYAAWRCADPGLQYDTTINEWHTCPQSGRINASNPCSEYMFLDDTACNLASVNLRRFYNEQEGVFNVEAFEHACRVWTVVLEISVLMAQYPSTEVAERSFEFRTLGLGYANLGSLLMVSGLAYDSPRARAMGAAITSIMTGVAYKTSAEMASFLGAFRHYEMNKENMLRVLRNHRYAAYHADDAYEKLHIKPQGINAGDCPDYLLRAACSAWDDALRLGEKFGFRNAQVSVIAPTGTIGLVMDCDTTGVEPDFALVKFKKLSGGGYFKIVNQSVEPALKKLGYSSSQVLEIIRYMKGHGTFKGAPFLNYETLLAKSLNKDELERLEAASASAFDIRFVINPLLLGKECLLRIGIGEQQMKDPSFNLLAFWGFTEEQIADANRFICGTMTIEGAPHLQEEHLSVFDCANKCGHDGKRYIHANGHLRMMAAVQPFISGAISKTINLPNESGVEDIAACYELGWKLGLKAVSIYRDGCKLSQPLSARSSKSQKAEQKSMDEMPVSEARLSADQVLDAAREIISTSSDTVFKRQLSSIVHRKRLPDRRSGFTQKAKIGGQTIFVRTGEYDDHTLGEIFVDLHKEGASFRSLMNCFSIAVSIGLQYGVPLEEFVEKFIFTRFDPSGPVDHPNIKSSTSVVDYIFRLLAMEYLQRYDLVQVPPALVHSQPAETKGVNPAAGKKIELTGDLQALQTQEYLSEMMGDAPVCYNCGHITIRSGTCFKCLNCGASLGCS